MHTIVRNTFCLLALMPFGWAQESGPVDGTALLAKGKQLYVQEGPNPALKKFEQAITIFRSNHDRHNEAITLGYIANCQRKLGNLDQALKLANQALQMKQELGDHNEEGNTRNQLGLIYWEQSDYPNAIQNLNKAVEIAAAVNDKELEGSARNNLGLVFDERGDYTHSLEQYQHALELHRATRFERGESDTLGNIGGIYLLLGKFREALPYYRNALEIDERLGLKPSQSDDFGDIALCQAGMGDIDEALGSFDRALQIAKESGLAKEEADWRKGKGTTLANLGRYDAALREYAAAEQVYERSGLQRELVEALNDTGTVYETLGDVAGAEARFQRALNLARKIGNESGEVSSTLALGDLERRRKRHEQAEGYFAAALTRARAAGDEGSASAALIRLGMNEIDRKNYEEALKIATEANQAAERLGNKPVMAESRYLLAEVQRHRAQFHQAIEEYSTAENFQKELRDPELGWRILYGRGQTLEAQEQNDEAISAYKEAVHLIEDTRAQISEERYRAGYIEERYQVYVRLVELLLKRGNPDEAFVYSEKLRARAYFDQLGTSALLPPGSDAHRRIQELAEQIRSLRHAIQKEYAASQKDRRGQALELYSAELARAERSYEDLLDSAQDPSVGRTPTNAVPSAADIQHLLPQSTAVVEFVVGNDSISALLITRESVSGVPIRIASESLSSRIELLRGLITERSERWTQPARGIYELLVTPLEREGKLRDVRRLLLVPDGVLNYIPFVALPNGSRYLGDEYSIAYLPSAAALAADESETSRGLKLLAMAPSRTHLPNTAAEARSIGGLFVGTSQVVSGNGATETLFKQAAASYDYLHLATHASLNRNAPSLSALDLQPDSQNDGRLELHEIAGMKLHAQLVTLSACETALGKGYFSETPAGNEFVGMTRAFLGAGSRRVLASLWAVNDESTRLLMVSFYRNLLRNGAADALSDAQRELRRNPKYRHPYYWAPFVMVGSIN